MAPSGAPGSLFACVASAVDISAECIFCLPKDDPTEVRHTRSPPTGPALALRVAHAPYVDGAGSRLGPFGVGDDIAVIQVEKLKAMEPLKWRQALAANAGIGATLYPSSGQRFAARLEYWRAKVVTSDGNGGFAESWCLLSSAVQAADRNIDVVQAAVSDATVAVGYASAFNAQTARLHAEEEGGDHDAESVVGVRVCVPVACYVLGGHATDVAQPGQAVTLVPYPYTQVTKFVFDGQDDFVELAQAFFHYCAWHSQGQEVVADLQGFEDEEGDIILVDPVIIRPAPVSLSELLFGAMGPASAGGRTEQTEASDPLRFDRLHPKCGQLCKAFDPSRRGAQCRRACGVSVPTCGMVGT